MINFIITNQIKFNNLQIPSSNRQHQLPASSASLVAAAAGNIVAAATSLITQPQQSKAARPSNFQTITIAPPKLPQTQQQPQPLLKVPQLGEVPLILPDHSVLEQFVQDKRVALNRLHEEAEGILDQTRGNIIFKIEKKNIFLNKSSLKYLIKNWKRKLEPKL